MKDKSLFTKVILVVVLALVCIMMTVAFSLLAGAIDRNLFDFKNLNFANVLPVLFIGIFISCAIVGIAILFVGKSAFLKVRDYFNENNKNNGGNKQ